MILNDRLRHVVTGQRWPEIYVVGPRLEIACVPLCPLIVIRTLSRAEQAPKWPGRERGALGKREKKIQTTAARGAAGEDDYPDTDPAVEEERAASFLGTRAAATDFLLRGSVGGLPTRKCTPS